MSRHGFSEVISCTVSKMTMMELVEECEDDEDEQRENQEEEVKRSMVSKRSLIEEMH